MSGLLTIGMAVANDWQGVWSTVLGLREWCKFKGEIVIVNNAPSTPAGESVAAIAREWGCKHVPFDKEHGTSQPRNEVFRQSSGLWTACIDSHIFFDAALMENWVKQIEEKTLPGYDDSFRDALWAGPLVMGAWAGWATHFRDQWGEDHMWGKWGLAWHHRSDIDCKFAFDVIAEIGDDGGMAVFQTVGMNPQTITSAGGIELPKVPFAGHEKALREAGFVAVGAMISDPPIDIPGQGLGMFFCRTDAWLGFHPLARGFGGEELTIHEKFREAGRRCLLSPRQKWHHRFAADKTNPGYSLKMSDRARNYALAVGELKSRDVHWPRLAESMAKALGPELWAKIEADPTAECKTCGTPAKQSPAPYAAMQPSDLLSMVKANKRDIDQQVDNLQKAIADCETITAIVKRREWDIVLLSAGGSLVSYNREIDAQLNKRLTELYGEKFKQIPKWPAEIDECDALVLDTEPKADRLIGDLTQYAAKVKKRIIIQASGTYGETGEGGGPGLLPALRKWLKENTDWGVVGHYTEGYGLTVVSRDPADRKALPSLLTQAWNLSQAMAKHVAGGLKTASEELAQLRLDTCTGCPMRARDRCSACGCFLEAKATMEASECPLGHWAKSEAAGSVVQPPSGL